jgi:capsule polysaccharide export protein KpsE/RkpR
MRELQEKHQIVDLDTQAKAVVGAIASLNGQRISKQLELDYARTFSSGDEATTRQLEAQIAVVNQTLRALQDEPPTTAIPGSQRASKRASNGMFPTALTVPKLREEFETLYRDRKVAEATLVFALERLESCARPTHRSDEVRASETGRRCCRIDAARPVPRCCGAVVDCWGRLGRAHLDLARPSGFAGR